MDQTREEFAILLLNKMREPDGFAGIPRLSGLSLPEAITRWMAVELALYLNNRLGENGWYPVWLQCQLLNEGLDRWSGVMGVSGTGTPRIRIDRTLLSQDLYHLSIGRGSRGNVQKRTVIGRLGTPEEDPERVFFFTQQSDRIDYNANGLMIYQSPDHYTRSMLRI